jgi:lipopolysaccharide/colanic/teichoic acid biosynthesis glycosyltransferase
MASSNVNKSTAELNDVQKLVLKYADLEVLQFIERNCTQAKFSVYNVISTKDIVLANAQGLVNLKKMNDIRYVNKFLEEINDLLPLNGILICRGETINARRSRQRLAGVPIVRRLFLLIEYIFLRVIPKVKLFKSIYFNLTKGRNRIMSKAEILGRLVSCGFRLDQYETISGSLYVKVTKIGKPKFDLNPSYGPVYKMPRVGKDSRIINVYKLRTMHPYSEYLQAYMFEKNGSANGDKIIDDFRVTPEGALLRKLWIDELPMVINLLKGDIKLVGVRPLSLHKFSLYPESVKELRVKSKPGLIPPFYADLPSDFDGLIASEVKYLKSYERSPIKTDFKYFLMAVNSILLKRARSS